MVNEIWENIKGRESEYKISNLGRVFSLPRFETYLKEGIEITRPIGNRMITPNDNGKGYLSVQLGKGKRYYVHRLVAQAFIANINFLPEINHVNGNRKDNKASNLEWCTRIQNIAHKEVTGTLLKGEDTPVSRLKQIEVLEIKSLLKDGEMQQIDIAKRFKVSPKCISDIKLGYTWRHLAM